MKEYGNRRSDEELAALTIASNAASYVLDDQPHFRGTSSQLERMQAIERAYIDGHPLLSDEEWDIMKAKTGYVESVSAGAPSGRKWEKMEAPLPSIMKITNQEDLASFFNKYEEGTEFLVESKLDGLTANLVYELDGDVYKRKIITSRGNGRYGMQLWPNALLGVKLRGYPESFPANAISAMAGEKPNRVEVRGEAVIPKGLWCNDRNISEDEKKSMVWRSIVSGIFNRKVPANIDGLCTVLLGKPAHDLIAENNGIFKVKSEDIVIARQLASLTNDSHRFLKSSTLALVPNNNGGTTIMIEHLDGTKVTFNAPNEYVDIVAYSIGIAGVNRPIIGTDLEQYFEINTKTCLMEDGSASPIFKRTSSLKEIVKSVAMFYGTDENWRRDKSLPRLRNMHEYAMDGVVIKLADTNIEEQGMTIRNNKSNKNKLVMPSEPSDAVAVKLLSETVRVKLERIEMTKTILGNVTCQGILDRPYTTESGASVSNINLHNPEWLRLNSWIKEGGEYDMCMAMDIIPTLIQPM